MTDEEKKTLSPVEAKVYQALEKVIDPELGIDIVNLGLIYGIKVDDQGKCVITMTYTMMGCPLSDYLNKTIMAAGQSVTEVQKCRINLVWEPTWNPSMMSRFAQMALGIHL